MVEGINNKIKVLKWVTDGYRNMDYFQLRLFALHDQVITQNLGWTEKEDLEKEVEERRDHKETIQSTKDPLDNLKPSRSNSPKSMKHF